MYFGGSVVGKTSTVVKSISHTILLTFTGGQKVRNLVSFKTSLNYMSRPRLKMQRDIRIMKQKCNVAMKPYVLAKFGEVRSMHP